MKPYFGVIVGVLLFGCGSSDNAGSATNTPTPGFKSMASSDGEGALLGAGSTFVDPAMTKWVEAYKAVAPSVSINYQALGSGAGVSQLKDGTVDFACADYPLDDQAISQMQGGVVQVPVTSGGVAIAYNVPNLKNPLNLSGDVLADIFLGKVLKWNDPRITAENPGVSLPDLAISVAHRSDGSGTTYIFTDYLSSVSAAWKSGPGKNKDIKWPVGTGGKGSAGVAGLVKRTPGGIGYVELAYAAQNSMPVSLIRNQAGKFVAPSTDSVSAAAASYQALLSKDLRTSIVNSASADAYPISGFTYAMLLKTPKDATKAKSVQGFLKWVLTSGQDIAKQLQYAPIPRSIADLDTKQLDGGQPK